MNFHTCKKIPFRDSVTCRDLFGICVSSKRSYNFDDFMITQLCNWFDKIPYSSVQWPNFSGQIFWISVERLNL